MMHKKTKKKRILMMKIKKIIDKEMNQRNLHSIELNDCKRSKKKI
ncbi:MAG: hypothetical protein ACRCX8_13455 [Sarcina sp.]